MKPPADLATPLQQLAMLPLFIDKCCRIQIYNFVYCIYKNKCPLFLAFHHHKPARI